MPRTSVIAMFMIAILMTLSPPAFAKAKYQARIGHLESPAQPRHQGLLKVAELVKQRTNGEVEFLLFPASQLGNARQQVEGTQFGSMQGTVMPAAFLGGFNQAVSALDLPYLYPADRVAAETLRQGPFGKAVLESFNGTGLLALAIWPNGRKNLTSAKPMNNADSLKGMRFRVMDSKILIQQFTGAGASAIVLPFSELYTSLQLGVVDGQENPLDTITTMNFHEVQKYLVVSEHGAMEDVFLFNPMWWNSLPKTHQDVIKTTIDEVRPEVEKNKELAQEKSMKIIKAAGVTVRIADEAERVELRKRMYPPAKKVYLKMSKRKGQKIIAVYEAEFKKLGP